MAVQKLGRVRQKPTRFLRRISEKSISYKILIIKTSNFIPNMNYRCSEDSFEVLHAFLAQKLTNVKFSPMIFLFLPSVSSATS